MSRLIVPAHHVFYGRFSPYHRGLSAALNSTLLVSTLTPSTTSQQLAVGRTRGGRGKYYCEFKINTINSPGLVVGLQNGGDGYNLALGSTANSYGYTSAGLKGYNNSFTAYGASYTANDVIGIALDLDNQTLTFYKNNTSQGATGFTPAQTGWFPAVSTAPSANNNSVTQAVELRLEPTKWGYAPPSGFGAFGDIVVPPPNCRWNPNDKQSGHTLDYDYRYCNNGAGGSTRATRFVSTGKWYWEVMVTSVDSYTPMIGFGNASATITGGYPGTDTNGLGYYGLNGNRYINSSATAYGATYGLYDIIGCALDMGAGTATFYKNGVSQGAITHGISGPLAPMVGNPGAGSQTVIANFHEREAHLYAPANHLWIGGWG